MVSSYCVSPSKCAARPIWYRQYLCRSVYRSQCYPKIFLIQQQTVRKIYCCRKSYKFKTCHGRFHTKTWWNLQFCALWSESRFSFKNDGQPLWSVRQTENTERISCYRSQYGRQMLVFVLDWIATIPSSSSCVLQTKIEAKTKAKMCVSISLESS